MNQFEYPGLADKIADALSFQRHAEKLPPSRVKLDAMELTYIWTCISYYVSSQQLKQADEAVAALSAKQRYDAYEIEKEESEPIERLRAFCSLAMSGQDWIDVEPLFDAITHPNLARADGLPPIPDTLPCETE